MVKRFAMKKIVTLVLTVTVTFSSLFSSNTVSIPVHAMENSADYNTVNDKMKMWYTSPANIYTSESNGGEWMQQSLPLGNGNLGNLIFGGISKVNASFFIMDSFDCATVYDHVGKVFGLCVKDGVVESPPLYHREALLIKKNGKAVIKVLDIRDMEIKIKEERYLHGQNAVIYTRPEYARVPKREKGKKIVIVGTKVIAVKEKGSIPIPASGFVLCLKDEFMQNQNIQPEDKVEYLGLEEIGFGIQVGNSIVRDGVKTEHFISKFYNIRKLEKIPYSPSLYPMDFNNGRAARIALGCDKKGKPMLFWAEGAGKITYIPGEDSTGASLKEMAEIAKDLGMVQAVNLDGGGSAQILLKNKRSLKISDRNKEDNSEAERLIPLGLVVR